jgi:branched-chain amino acid transport system permease protein
MGVEAFSMLVLGGATSLGGALTGAIFLRYAQYALAGGMQLIVTGAGVLFVLLVLPGGLAQVTAGLRKRVFSLVARLRRIELPGAAGGEPPPDISGEAADVGEVLVGA